MALTKGNIQRVERAFAWAQHFMGTAFVFGFEVMSAADAEKDVFSIDWTERGAQDPDHFVIEVSSDLPKKATELRAAALHEVIHAVLWPLSEWAEVGLTGDKLAAAVAANEKAVYTIQRALTGVA